MGFSQYANKYDTRLHEAPSYRSGARGPDQITSFAFQANREYQNNAESIRDRRLAMSAQVDPDVGVRQKRERMISDRYYKSAKHPGQLEGLYSKHKMNLSQSGGALGARGMPSVNVVRSKQRKQTKLDATPAEPPVFSTPAPAEPPVFSTPAPVEPPMFSTPAPSTPVQRMNQSEQNITGDALAAFRARQEEPYYESRRSIRQQPTQEDLADSRLERRQRKDKRAKNAALLKARASQWGIVGADRKIRSRITRRKLRKDREPPMELDAKRAKEFIPNWMPKKKKTPR